MNNSMPCTLFVMISREAIYHHLWLHKLSDQLYITDGILKPLLNFIKKKFYENFIHFRYIHMSQILFLSSL